MSNLFNLSSVETFEILNKDQNAVLVDVRTPEEWEEIGAPKMLPEMKNRLLFITWTGSDQDNANKFLQALKSETKDTNNNIFFLCRSGGRSSRARNLASENGFTNAYNIIDGFEGGVNGLGWKSSNLPWEYIDANQN